MEFDRLMQVEQDPVGAVFQCHRTIRDRSKEVCAGWLLLQKRTDLPSVALRMHLHRNLRARRCLERVTDGGHDLYGSVVEMVAANEALGRCACGRYLKPDGLCGTCSST